MAPASSKSTRAPAFQFYPKEFLSSSKVMAMSALERGAYITLLCVQWLDGSLPNDLSALARLTGISKQQFLKIWPINLGRCFVLKHGRYLNLRLESERTKQAEFRQKQHDAAASRWHKPNDATALPDMALPPESQRNALRSAIASASAVSDLQTAVSEARRTPTPIVQKRKKGAAFEGARGLYVMSDQHARFVGFRNHAGAEAELFAFYEQTAESYRGEIDPDMYRFWAARYAEQWPAPRGPVAQRPATMPEYHEWECRHIDRCANRDMCEHKKLLPAKYPEKAAS